MQNYNILYYLTRMKGIDIQRTDFMIKNFGINYIKFFTF